MSEKRWDLAIVEVAKIIDHAHRGGSGVTSAPGSVVASDGAKTEVKEEPYGLPYLSPVPEVLPEGAWLLWIDAMGTVSAGGYCTRYESDGELRHDYTNVVLAINVTGQV